MAGALCTKEFSCCAGRSLPRDTACRRSSKFWISSILIAAFHSGDVETVSMKTIFDDIHDGML